MKKVLFIAALAGFVAATAYSRAGLPKEKGTLSKNDHDSSKHHKKMGKKGGKRGSGKTKNGGGGGY